MKKTIILLIIIFKTLQIMAQQNTDIALIPIDRPIWSLGLNDPKWLLPNIDREKKIAIFAFNKIFKQNEQESEQTETEIGRVSRAIPMYIMERLYFETNIAPTFFVACKQNIGPLISGVRTIGAEISESLKHMELDYIVTGVIEEIRNDIKIDIYLYETSSDKEFVITSITSSNKDFDELSVNTTQDFLSKFKSNYKMDSKNQTNIFKAPKNDLISYYIKGIGQLLMQVLVNNDVMPYESLWGEDDMLEWYFDLTSHEPDNISHQLLYFNGIISSISYGGQAYKNQIERIEYYIEHNDNSNLIVKLSPILYYKLDDKTKLANSLSRLEQINNQEYIDWISKYK